MTQGSADPPEHLRERGVPSELRRGSPNADAAVGERDGGDREAREPAPGDANPLADPEGSRDRRTSSLE